MATSSKEIATVSTTGLSLEQFEEAIRNPEIELPEMTEENAGQDLIERILRAESDEEVQIGEALSWSKDLLGVPVTIRSVTPRRSNFVGEDAEGGSAVYVIVQGDVPNPQTGQLERQAISCGGRTVLAQIANTMRRGTLLGSTWKLEKAKTPTARGFHPLQLVKVADADADQAAA